MLMLYRADGHPNCSSGHIQVQRALVVAYILLCYRITNCYGPVEAVHSHSKRIKYDMVMNVALAVIPIAPCQVTYDVEATLIRVHCA